MSADADRQISTDVDTRNDLNDVLDALSNGRAGDTAEGPSSAGGYRDATDAARLLHREVSDALLDLKDEVEPGWVRRTDSGRLNVRRLLGGVDADELFDRYEPGQHDAADMEVAVLLDISGSMNRHRQTLAEAAWSIRQSVEDLEGLSTVMTYNDRHETMADAGERPDGRMFVPDISGGTNPKSALSSAYQILAGSEARIRMMVILTDGSWGATEASEDIIAAMREVGIVTVLAYLNSGETTEEPVAHGCEVAESIEQPQGLARLFRKVAISRIGKW